jgi:hypothetical protein
MATHTPGPWRVVVPPAFGATTAEIVAGEGEPFPIASVLRDRRPRQRLEDDANAHLIAAAPELLAVLKAALTELTGADDSLQAVLKILAEAIATAEGGEG